LLAPKKSDGGADAVGTLTADRQFLYQLAPGIEPVAKVLIKFCLEYGCPAAKLMDATIIFGCVL
jgi:hypothetical protein